VRISDDPHRFDPGSELVHADGRTLIIESARSHHDRFLVKFEGFSSRSDAESLRGALSVPADKTRSLGDAEYWADDLAGCNVALADGTEVGVAREVVPGTAHDLLVVDTKRGEGLVPMVRAIVTDVDLDKKLIVLDPPEGLLA